MRRAGVLLFLILMFLAGKALCETRLMVVSDIHHLAPSLIDDRDALIALLKTGDGKLTQYSDVLLDALAQEVSEQMPDALIVTGDLTFNGERASHEALAEAFGCIEAQGVPVWVIPGNHDINASTPVRFVDGGYIRTDGVDAEAFRAIYRDHLGAPTDGANLSCAVPIDDRLWVAMTDVSFYDGMSMTFGLFTSGHRDWLRSVLQDARARDVEVVTATHHSLLKHTDFSVDSFLMFGHEGMEALLRQSGVRLNLSGHLHVQHLLTDDGLTDAALGAFCIWPHRYAIVTLADDGQLTWSAHALSDTHLPKGFLEMSRNWYLDIATQKALSWLADADLSEADREAMARYAARFNLAYFSGAFRPDDPSWKEDDAYALWQGLGGNPFWEYMRLVMEGPWQDALKVTIKKDGRGPHSMIQ